MGKGFLSIVLHAHLPFVRHPEHEYFLEEMWLYEAITETYVPLIHMMEGFERDNVPWRLTMSLTPSLMSMLRDPLLQDRYVRHIDKLIELANKEIERTRFMPQFHETALHYYWEFTRAKDTFVNRYHRDLTQAFRKFQDHGHLEIITCGATHGFLPLISRTESAVRGQIETAAKLYDEVLGRRPIGIWLPECGYYPGVDKFLKEQGIRYFLTDTHGILHASPRPKYGIFAPVFCPTGVAAFGRDVESSKQVWSSVEGYPGDCDYREFYRDIGYELDFDYVRPYISPDGIRVNTGIKYYRITGDTEDKQPYVRAWAMEKAASHAGNFMFNREKQIEHLYEFMGRKPIVVAPYDAELYGHWWYEGPDFLNFLIRKVAFDQNTVRLISPSDYFREYPVNQISTPSFSSWGWKGYSETWLSGANDWIYRHIHKATLRMSELANRYRGQNGLVGRALKQAARELYLAQSSDWAFIMHTGTMVPYAVKRTKEHLLNFTRIYEDLTNDRLDEGFLRDLESRNNIFPNVDYHVF
ncbi:MAG: 1,4-alpha-glucan branching enzyme [Candidatus Omnitrophica bacterium ADurb.Bin277]|nr:MAG: 1,4-alpha-glucan branching enzyme [Candidatus Omnitrophica bacterium ADurb.Bin277]